MTAVEFAIEAYEKFINSENGSGGRYFHEQLVIDIEKAKAIDKEQKTKDMIGLLQWMNKIASETPMRLETDLDDIVEQYYNETYGRN